MIIAATGSYRTDFVAFQKNFYKIQDKAHCIPLLTTNIANVFI